MASAGYRRRRAASSGARSLGGRWSALLIIMASSLVLLPACSVLVDFPGDCLDEQCPGGLSCDAEGVQCLEICTERSHCQDGWECNTQTGQCRLSTGGHSDAGNDEDE